MKELKTEYKQTPCIYCGERKLINKTKWAVGEKLARGHSPENFNYYQCKNPNCGKVSMSNKEVKIQ